MANGKHTLIAWLRDAHAMERTSVDNLNRLADRFSRHPELAVRFREHWRESVGQVEALEACLKKLGSDTSTFKDLASRFVGIAQAYSGVVSLDEPVKDCLAAYASMHHEIAAYVSLRAAAQELAQPEITRMCDAHLARERAMAGWLEEQIAAVTLEFLRP
ncbi:MAG TPA: ferritin-like domain-containing protein [Steroidobacteraceae bacterium]|nr:ferritin-like domain-containing protein [Steroidobacteraceae bacterium]